MYSSFQILLSVVHSQNIQENQCISHIVVFSVMTLILDAVHI